MLMFHFISEPQAGSGNTKLEVLVEEKVDRKKKSSGTGQESKRLFRSALLKINSTAS